MKKILILALALCTAIVAGAQAKTDTVIVELAKTSKVVFTMKERSDMETLKQYDFQALFADILAKLENKDTAKVAAVDTVKNITTTPTEIAQETWGDDDDEQDWDF